MDFKNKVLIIGYGAVAKCTLPILLRHVTIPLENITIIDFKEKSQDLKAWTSRGLRFFRQRVTHEDLDRILSSTFRPVASLSTSRGISTAARSSSGATTTMSCT